MDKNNEAISLFEDNKFESAFLGLNGFFIKDNTWGTHDSLLVFKYLFEWIKNKKETSNIIIQIAETFKKILLFEKRINPIDNGLESVNLIRSYCIMANEQNYWIVEKEYLTELLNNFVKQRPTEEMTTLKIDRDIKLLSHTCLD
jgi:hypothetical protein